MTPYTLHELAHHHAGCRDNGCWQCRDALDALIAEVENLRGQLRRVDHALGRVEDALPGVRHELTR